MQGRVRPTLQLKGDVEINDDVELEREADRTAQRLSTGQGIAPAVTNKATPPPSRSVRQLKLEIGTETYDENNVGELMVKYMRGDCMPIEVLALARQQALDTDKTYHYDSVADLIAKLSPQITEVEIKENEAPSTVLTEPMGIPVQIEVVRGKNTGVARLLHTVWVGGQINYATKESLARWSQTGKAQLILWMDQSAIERNEVVQKDLQIEGIPIYGFLPVGGPTEKIVIPVASTLSLKMEPSLAKAAQVEATDGLPQVASDILRIAILHQFGGIYIDVGGVTPGPNFAPENVEFFGGMDVQPGFHKETGHMENGLILARQGSPILLRMLNVMSTYYQEDSHARITYQGMLINSSKKSLSTMFEEDFNGADFVCYVENRQFIDPLIAELVNMPEKDYLAFMESKSEIGAVTLVKKWKSYIDHLRTLPLTLLTDKIRPEIIKEFGTQISHSINIATMRDAFQCSIEEGLKQESKVKGKDVLEKDLLAHWKTNYSEKQFHYSQIGYSWQNPGLSAAEEMERLVNKGDTVYDYFLRKELPLQFAQFQPLLQDQRGKTGTTSEDPQDRIQIIIRVQSLLDPNSGLLSVVCNLLARKAPAIAYERILQQLQIAEEFLNKNWPAFAGFMVEDSACTWAFHERDIINVMRNVVYKIMRFTELVQGKK
jgi:hypothetical protein